MIRISVSASKNYDVIMEKGALSRIAKLMAEAGCGPGISGNAAQSTDSSPTQSAKDSSNHCRRLCIVTDKTVDALYGGSSGALRQSLQSAGFRVHKYVFDGGEKNKNMSTVTAILNFLADSGFSRSDILLALGGGIVGDVTGFCASIYMRGIDYIQVPTTLLATVDSSVGGKTGVNLNAGKNLAGAFWQPSLVVFDPDVLNTLPDEMILDGIAEAVKAGFIADKAIIDAAESCSSLKDHDFLTKLAAMAVEVKKNVVEEDERESGKRQLLNFGHTVAHAIEKCSDYEVSHGHAVATGMVIAAAAADELGWSKERCAGKITAILQNFGFPLACPYDVDDLTAAALHDKKVRSDTITLVIPDVPGRCTLRNIPTDQLKDFISRGTRQLAALTAKGAVK